MLKDYALTLLMIPVAGVAIGMSWLIHVRSEQQAIQRQLRSSVEQTERATDAKVKGTQRRDDAKPASKVLDGWFRD